MTENIKVQPLSPCHTKFSQEKMIRGIHVLVTYIFNIKCRWIGETEFRFSVSAVHWFLITVYLLALFHRLTKRLGHHGKITGHLWKCIVQHTQYLNKHTTSQQNKKKNLKPLTWWENSFWLMSQLITLLLFKKARKLHVKDLPYLRYSEIPAMRSLLEPVIHHVYLCSCNQFDQKIYHFIIMGALYYQDGAFE